MEEARAVLTFMEPPTVASVTRLAMLEVRHQTGEAARHGFQEAVTLASLVTVPTLTEVSIKYSRFLQVERCEIGHIQRQKQ